MALNGTGTTELLKQLYDQARSKVMVGDKYSEWFKNTVGVRQGCPLPPTLFNLFLDKL